MKRLFLVATCFTYAQLLDQQCKDYCLYVENERGAYFSESDVCYCAHPIDKEHLNEKRLSLPHKISRKESTHSSVSVPYKLPDDEVKLPWDSD